MGKPTAYDVAMKAIQRLQGEEILYQDEVCDVFLERTIALCGGQLDGDGTNDLFRNHCNLTADFDWREPGDLAIGDVLFIRESVSGDTKEKYRDDGIGDVNHIGMFVGPIPGYDPAYCVIHSSQKKGRVAASTLQNAWNRRGRLDCLEYEAGADAGEAATAPAAGEAGPAVLYRAVVRTDEDNLNFRREPSLESGRVNGMKVIPRGAAVEVLEELDGEWARVAYQGHTGYAAREFLQRIEKEVPEEAPEEEATESEAPAQVGPGCVVRIHGYLGGVLGGDDAAALLALAENLGYDGTILVGED